MKIRLQYIQLHADNHLAYSHNMCRLYMVHNKEISEPHTSQNKNVHQYNTYRMILSKLHTRFYHYMYLRKINYTRYINMLLIFCASQLYQ